MEPRKTPTSPPQPTTIALLMYFLCRLVDQPLTHSPSPMWIRRWGIAIKMLHKVWEFFDLCQDSGSYLCLAFPPQSPSLNQWLAKQQAKVCPLKNVHSIFFLLSSISGPGCPKPGSISSPATPSSAPFHANPSPRGNHQEFISILQHLSTLDWKWFSEGARFSCVASLGCAAPAHL